jgi:hypothetical protein
VTASRIVRRCDPSIYIGRESGGRLNTDLGDVGDRVASVGRAAGRPGYVDLDEDSVRVDVE